MRRSVCSCRSRRDPKATGRCIMERARKPRSARLPPVPSDSHAAIEQWVQRVMPHLHPTRRPPAREHRREEEYRGTLPRWRSPRESSQRSLAEAYLRGTSSNFYLYERLSPLAGQGSWLLPISGGCATLEIGRSECCISSVPIVCPALAQTPAQPAKQQRNAPLFRER
jgi:hypothetical protein